MSVWRFLEGGGRNAEARVVTGPILIQGALIRDVRRHVSLVHFPEAKPQGPNQ